MLILIKALSKLLPVSLLTSLQISASEAKLLLATSRNAWASKLPTPFETDGRPALFSLCIAFSKPMPVVLLKLSAKFTPGNNLKSLMVALLVLGLLLSFLKMYVEMRLYLLRLHHTCQGDERK
jgi:hypothetical protein